MIEFSDSAPLASIESPGWHILTKLGHLTLVFPSALVAETFLIERSQILTLPFYDPVILGCIHHTGQIVPLICGHRFLGIKGGPTRESLTIVRLSDAAADLAGIGLAVDTLLGRQLRDQLPPELFEPGQLPTATIVLFRPEILGTQLWQPQRWWTARLQPLG